MGSSQHAIEKEKTSEVANSATNFALPVEKTNGSTEEKEKAAIGLDKKELPDVELPTCPPPANHDKNEQEGGGRNESKRFSLKNVLNKSEKSGAKESEAQEGDKRVERMPIAPMPSLKGAFNNNPAAQNSNLSDLEKFSASIERVVTKHYRKLSQKELQDMVSKDSNGSITATLEANKVVLSDGTDSVSFKY